MKLLLVEDDAMLGAAMKRGLEKAGYVVDWAQDGDEALGGLSAQAYETVILDLSLPQVDGIEVLKRMRARRDTTPVIIVTARGRGDQKIDGLDAGADDYLVKPFDLDELLARIRAQIRRAEGRVNDVLRVKDVALDIGARLVRRGDAAVQLTAKELRVLDVLMRRAGRFVSKDDLENALYDAAGGVESNTIEVTIYALRKKLGTDFILTARGLGYMVGK
ncbi:response regulator transcription factor [Caulobacter sp. FWC2]|uniref:response regulator transcription factor n=1 Tax=Caulobacter sp. FWC2 TaxID=69664 RepID=UPI000C1477C5|nr:response regulator transcription factor [Caulobacter sp. FWC2]PIB92202.1 DNA-binding response regulator [Caulobacter sp. FWC2]